MSAHDVGGTPMTKDLGTKYDCFKCATKFYDLKKPVPACPKCGVDQRSRPAAPVKASPKRATPATEARSEGDEVETDPEAEVELDDAAEADAT
jgi:hypothetical protein